MVPLNPNVSILSSDFENIMLCFIDSDADMLAIWKDMSVKYKSKYSKDRSHEYIEVSLIDRLHVAYVFVWYRRRIKRS